MAFVFHAADWIGLTRSHQQDRTLALPSRGLFAVLDGFGAFSGEVATEIAAEILERAFEAPPAGSDDPGPRLAAGLKDAGHAIWIRGQADPLVRGAGCTAAAVVLDGDRVWIAHAGEARVYLAGVDAGERITRDHTLAHELVDAGAIPPGEARTNPHRDVITRALGTSPDMQAELTERRLHPGDRLLLATDGVWRYAEEDRVMLDLMREADSPQALVEALFAHAGQGGANDNLAAVAIEIT